MRGSWRTDAGSPRRSAPPTGREARDMCQFLSFVTRWKEGNGLQVYAAPSLRGHGEAVSTWGLQKHDVFKFAWETEGEDNLVLSHEQTPTPDAERVRLEVLRLWPQRSDLVMYLIGKLLDAGKLGGDLFLYGCVGLTALPEGLTVGGDLYLPEQLQCRMK